MKTISSILTLLFGVLFVMVVTTHVSAQTGQETDKKNRISIKTEVDRNKITLGDVFTYSIVIRHNPDIAISLPGWGANVGQFEIRDYNLEQETDVDGTSISSSLYSLAIYDTGSFTIPAISVTYTVKGSEDSLTLLSDSVDIDVESIAPSEADDVKGLKGQAVIAPDYRQLSLIIAAVVFLLIVTGSLVYYFKKIRNKKEPLKETYLGPPHEIALAELETLLARKLLDQGLVKPFYFELSEIIRRYLGRRFQIYTLERTTEEIRQQVEDLYLATDVFRLIIDFLQDTDLVKFAKYIPDDNENDAIVVSTRTIIDKTKIFTAPVQSGIQSEVKNGTGSDENRDEHDSELSHEASSGASGGAAEPEKILDNEVSHMESGTNETKTGVE